MPAVALSKVVALVRRLTDVETRGQSDRQLLERFTGANDELAFAELVRRHGPMVLAVCQRVLRHHQDAEDAFQAAFLVLARKAAFIREHDSIGGWLYQVTHRLAVRAKTLGHRRASRFTPLCAEPAATELNPIDESLRTAIDEELALLPEGYRSAIVLCYLEGKTQSEAARMLATTTDAVNSRLKRARDILRQRLARHGLVLTAGALLHAIAGAAAQASLPATLIGQTARAALQFMTYEASATGVSAFASSLAKGALHTMVPAKTKILSLVAMVLTLLTSTALLLPSNAQEEPAALALRGKPKQFCEALEELVVPKGGSAKKQRHCIIIWLNGGPSQIDTFDPKAGQIALFKPIDTNVKGIQFSETLPLLAKQANHLTILRGVSHREGDHARATHLMHTGFVPGAVAYPSLGSVLGKELGEGLSNLPRFVRLGSGSPGPGIPDGPGPGILGAKYGPLNVTGPVDEVPSAEAFEALDLDKDKAVAMRKAVAKAFDLGAEKAEMRDAYGRGRFGTSCLLARRLIETGVPVVQATLGGWDTHGNAIMSTKKACRDLDAGLATLIKDLHERKLLDSTLIVCTGEFGRTPTVNAMGGRDHWPLGFSVAMAGGGIKGGQVIGKTSADATKVEERPVTPQELLATVYQAVGVDSAKKNRTPGGKEVPLVERGNNAVKEALP